MTANIRRYYFIKNFPKNYPWYKKIVANIIFFITGTIIHPRKNLLTNEDIKQAKKIIKRGDIILLGNLRTALSEIINDPLTHSSIYMGGRKIIHAMGAEGVQYASYHSTFTNYDTVAVVRIPEKKRNRKEIIKKVIKYAKNQLKKPYDFEFKKGEKKFFCTKLVNNCFTDVGYDTGLSSIKKSKSKNFFSRAKNALRPIDFIKGNFETVFLSHNLKLKNKKLTFIKKKFK